VHFETGVPIPSSRSRGGRRSAGWEMMQIGQSVFFEGKKYRAVRGTARYLKRRYGFACLVRSVERGVRIWRTA